MNSKNTFRNLLLSGLLVTTALCVLGHGEEAAPAAAEAAEATPVAPPQTIAGSPEALRLQRFRQAAKAKLLSKLKNEDGGSNAIYVMPPIDYTTLQMPKVVLDTIRQGIQVYDPAIQVKEGNFPLASVTLEQLRLAMIRLSAQILVVTVIYPTNIDLYLYDKRTPFQIYAHSEPISATSQYDFTKEMAVQYTKLLVRRTLYRYIKNQYYELPRDNSAPVLQTEIPRYIASYQSVEMVNREERSHIYAAGNWGVALSSAPVTGMWNSNLFSAQLGVRLYGNLFAEGAIELSAYNSVVAGIKYLFSNKDMLFRFMGGLGVAQVSNRHTFDWDRSNGIKDGAQFVVPSVSILLPISEVYLKAEVRYFYNIGGEASLFTIMPGLFVMF